MEGVITRKQIAGITIEIQETRIGDDIVLILAGGDKPHIGCVVQAVPRPSLTNDGSISVTSSVLNLTGHKDEFLCRKLAEKRCRETGRIVVYSVYQLYSPAFFYGSTIIRPFDVLCTIKISIFHILYYFKYYICALSN